MDRTMIEYIEDIVEKKNGGYHYILVYRPLSNIRLPIISLTCVSTYQFSLDYRLNPMHDKFSAGC